MPKLATLLAWGLAIAAATAASAAPPAKKAGPRLEASMQVNVVRSAHPGCEPNCIEWIAAQGKIDFTSPSRFRKVLRKLGKRKLPVFIDSAGGSVNDALAIGRMIRAKGLDVIVTRTELMPCPAADSACRRAEAGGELRGLAKARISKCASSCAFILAAGTHRFVGAGTAVGVHQITMIMRRYRILTQRSFGIPVGTRKTLLSEQTMDQDSKHTQSTYGTIARYFAQMGISDGIMPLITSTPGDKVHWLTADELRATRLATHFMNGEQIVTATRAPTAAAAEATPKPSLTAQDACGKSVSASRACAEEPTPGVTAPNVPAALPAARARN